MDTISPSHRNGLSQLVDRRQPDLLLSSPGVIYWKGLVRIARAAHQYYYYHCVGVWVITHIPHATSWIFWWIYHFITNTNPDYQGCSSTFQCYIIVSSTFQTCVCFVDLFDRIQVRQGCHGARFRIDDSERVVAAEATEPEDCLAVVLWRHFRLQDQMGLECLVIQPVQYEAKIKFVFIKII